MASSGPKSATRMPGPVLDRPGRPSPASGMTANGGKPGDPRLRRRPAASAVPKKAIRDGSPASANKRGSQTACEAKQGAKGRSLSTVQLNGQSANRARRERTGVKGRRRGYHISDLPSRRRALTYRMHPSKKEIQLRRNVLHDAATGFPLVSLEEYLKQRPSGPNHATQTAADMGSPSSFLSSMQKRGVMLSNQRSVLLGESASQFAGIGAKDPWVLKKLSVQTCVSDHESNNAGNCFNLDRSRHNKSFHQPATHRPSKNEGLLHYAGSCFNVSTRRVEGRRRHVAYMYNSERSMSPLCSETEMAPLMTEPEPFHEFSDDQSASSVEFHEPQGQYGELTYNKHKDMHSKGCKPAVNAYKDLRTGDNFYMVQDVAIKKPKDMACKHRSISQKYRPKLFKDILGQKIVAESLSNAILRSKIAPVYLFHGPRGTGKTTAAKIFTCAMNCLSIEELRPCGLCKECTSFNAGTSYDVREVDAAGNNEIESMKVMLKHLCQRPSISRYKIFIMDDCHWLTPEAWNALLKSLEEPPEYVVFILITTNLELVPRAAISRCQKFMFSRIKDADIVFRLSRLAQLEKVDIDMDALHFIACQSDGSLRDAEMMLDQLSLLGKKATLDTVRQMVGLIPEDDLINLLEMALSEDTVNTVNTIRELMGSGVEPIVLTSQLAMLITDILAGRCQVARYAGMTVRKGQRDKLQHALKILSDLEKQLRSCSDRTTWFTAAFLQLSTTSNVRPLSSRGTSAVQSPAVFAGVSDNETCNLDGAGRRYSWGGKEKWDEYEVSQGDILLCESSSGPFMDTRIYPCDQSPYSGTSVDEGLACKVPGRTAEDVFDITHGTLSPRSMNEVWQKVLRGNSSESLKQLLRGESKLASISLTEDFALIRIEFRSSEHKSMAERAKQSLSKAFQMALLCPVKMEISLSPSQGGGASADKEAGYHRGYSERHSKGMLLDHDNLQGSFRKASFRNREFTAPSPKCHRDLMQSNDGYTCSNSTRDGNTSCRDCRAKRGTGEPTRYLNRGATGYASEHQPSKQQRSSFDDSRFSSASLRWSDTREDMEYSSDSEIDGRYAPGLLCWKGSRMKDGRRKHHVIRRRKTRFLLRLVPCGKEEGEDDEKARTGAEG